MITKAELIALLQNATHIPDTAVLLTESEGLHLVAPAKVTGMIVPSPVKVRGTYWDVEIVIEPSGTVARCATVSEIVGTCPLTGVPIVRKVFGEVTGLPTDGTPCLVSIVVLGACAGMPGVFAPDTSPENVVRDSKGLVYGVKALVAA